MEEETICGEGGGDLGGQKRLEIVLLGAGVAERISPVGRDSIPVSSFTACRSTA